MFCPHCGKSILDGSVFCSFCAKPTASAPVAAKKSSPLDSALRIFGAVAIIIVAVIILGVYLNSRSTVGPAGGPSPAANPLAAIIHQPMTQNVFSGQLVVGARQYRAWTITISPQMTSAQLVGSFHATGGTGNGIQAVIADPPEFENWKNGHQAKVYYGTGRTTNGNFNGRLAPGTYILAFSNAFSLLVPKEVTAEIELRYLR